MKVSTMFPSRYANGNDLQGKAVALTIARVVSESMRDSKTGEHVKKWVCYFREAKKGVILNKTVAGQIAEALGAPDTDDWTGKRVLLYPTMINAFGEQHNVIHFRAVNGTTPAPAPESLTEEPHSGGEEEDF